MWKKERRSRKYFKNNRQANELCSGWQIELELNIFRMKRRRTSSHQNRNHLPDKPTYQELPRYLLLSLYLFCFPISSSFALFLPPPPPRAFVEEGGVGSHNSQSFLFLAIPKVAQVDEEEVQNDSRENNKIQRRRMKGMGRSTWIVVRRFSRGNRSGTTSTRPLGREWVNYCNSCYCSV